MYKVVTPQVTPQVIPQVTPQVTPQVNEVVKVLIGKKMRVEIQELLGLTDKRNFNDKYIIPALKSVLVEKTIPNIPKSRLQKFRLTELGKETQKKITE
jgi:hypothetical protein